MMSLASDCRTQLKSGQAVDRKAAAEFHGKRLRIVTEPFCHPERETV